MFLLVTMSELARPDRYFVDSFRVFASYDEAYRSGCEYQEAISQYPAFSDFCIIDLNHYCVSDLPVPCKFALDCFLHNVQLPELN